MSERKPASRSTGINIHEWLTSNDECMGARGIFDTLLETDEQTPQFQRNHQDAQILRFELDHILERDETVSPEFASDISGLTNCCHTLARLSHESDAIFDSIYRLSATGSQPSQLKRLQALKDQKAIIDNELMAMQMDFEHLKFSVGSCLILHINWLAARPDADQVLETMFTQLLRRCQRKPAIKQTKGPGFGSITDPHGDKTSSNGIPSTATTMTARGDRMNSSGTRQEDIREHVRTSSLHRSGISGSIGGDLKSEDQDTRSTDAASFQTRPKRRARSDSNPGSPTEAERPRKRRQTDKARAQLDVYVECSFTMH